MKKLIAALLVVVAVVADVAAAPVHFTGFEEGDTSGIQSQSGSNAIICSETPISTVRTGKCAGRIIGVGNFRVSEVSSSGPYTAAIRSDNTCATMHFYYVGALATSTREEILLALGADTAAVKAYVKLNNSGKLELYDSTNTLKGTGTATINASTYYRIEANICTGASCTSTVSVNGSTDISASGNYGTEQNGSFRFGSVTTGGNTLTYFYDDIILDDSSCQGNIRVKRIPLEGDGALSQWVPNSGVDLWTQVASWPVDTTASPLTGNRIKSTASGLPEYATFNVGSASGDAPTGAIRSVRAHAYARQDPTGSGTSAFGLIIRNNEFEVASGTNTLDTTIRGRGLVRNVDPFTGVAWQPDGVQTMEIGVYENNAVVDTVLGVQAFVAYDETAVVPTPTPAPTYIPPTAPAAGFVSSYPGASGYGIASPAGSGRHAAPTPAPGAYGTVAVMKITNLNDSGTGSFRACLEASGPRTCIFEISGYIDLLDSIRVTNPYLTVAGQTAPAPGIHVRGGRIDIETHDVLFQNFSLRPGDSTTGSRISERDAMTITSASGNPVYNIQMHRMTFAHGLDENVATYAGNTILFPIDNINFHECFLHQGLNNSVRGTYYRGCNKAQCDANPTVCTAFCASPPCGQCTDYKVPHGKDMIIDKTTRISIHETIMAESEDRHPRIKPGTELEFYNNYVYGWAGSSTWQMMNCAGTAGGEACKLSVAGNVYKRAPYSQIAPILYHDSTVPVLSRAFMFHNICPTRPIDISSEWLCSNWPQAWQVFSPPIPESGVPPKLPGDTVAHTLANSGARPWNRWIGDQNVINDIISEGGSIKDCISGCPNAVFPGGWPTITPVTRALTPPPVPNFVESNGRTAIENFIHSFTSDAGPAYTPQPTPGATNTPTPAPSPTATRTPRPTRTATPVCS